MSNKEDMTVSANFEVLMDYYKAYADELTPQPIIQNVDVVFKGKYNTLALGRVSLRFVYVTEGCIELMVLTELLDRFTILMFKADEETTLEVTYPDGIDY